MKIAVLIARILLGLIFVVFGLNFFFHFITMAQPPMSAPATAFSGGLFGSGYFFSIYESYRDSKWTFFLLINRYTALFVVVLFPISLNVFLFHAILVPSGIPLGTMVLLLNLFLAFAYRKYYSSLFTVTPTV